MLAAVLLGMFWLATGRLVYDEPPARAERLAGRRVSLAAGDGRSRILAAAAVLTVMVAPAADMAVSGPCVLTNGGSCVTSRNYPAQYGSNKNCVITGVPPVLLVVVVFVTEDFGFWL